MICKVCSNYFNPLHFNQKCCSRECKKRARVISVRKYKDTDKGKSCLDRWYKSPTRIECEKRYRSKPKTKALQVKRTTEYYKKHPEIKKRNEKAYAFRRRGYNAGYIDWKAVESLERICVMCKSIEDLTIDHIKPLSKDGTNDINNLQILCRRCNATKGTKYEV